MWSRRDFSLLDIFDSIDRYRDGYVTEYSLRSFLSRNGHFVTDDDILAIMRRLDHDEDGRLNSFEFNEALMKAETGIRSRDHGSFTPSASIRRPLSASPVRRSLYNTSPRRAPAPRMESLTPMRPSLNRSEILHTPSPVRRAASPDRSFNARSSFQTPPRASRAGSPPRELKRSPLRFSEEFELIDTLKEQINLDKSLERAKEDLALRADFNTIDTFDLFDSSRRSNLDFYDIKDTFNLFGVYPDNDELNLLIKKYDKDFDGKWRYSEFLEAILPKKH